MAIEKGFYYLASASCRPTQMHLGILTCVLSLYHWANSTRLGYQVGSTYHPIKRFLIVALSMPHMSKNPFRYSTKVSHQLYLTTKIGHHFDLRPHLTLPPNFGVPQL